jgi:murein L,D-transpeptidase YcbB/YkuD
MKLKSIMLIAMMVVLNASASASMLNKLGWVSSNEELQRYHYPKQLEQLYSRVRHQFIWLDPTLSEELEYRLHVIHLAQISPEFSTLYIEMQQAKAGYNYYRYELLASDALLRYLSYGQHARRNAEQWFHGQKVSRHLPAISNQQIVNVAEQILTNNLEGVFATSHPVAGIYNQSRPVLEQLLATASQTNIEPRFNQLLSRGVSIYDPVLLHHKLRASGLDPNPSLLKQKTYNWEWQQQIKALQALHGLKADGIVGEQTLYWINYPVSNKARILALNIERERGFSTQKRAYIQVNLPQYQMKFWANNQLEFKTRVIVGKEERPTPLMWTSLSTIVVNPTWNIPVKIMRKDLLPKIARNNQYLANENITIIPYWGSDKTIDSSTINWSRVDAETFNYRMTQSSGSHNALGQYKFLLPNDRAIYLHDTSAKDLFGKESRALSSGCVRVEKADQFAQSLLKVSGQSQSDLDSADSNKKIRMKRGIPVEFIYRTAWVEDGKLHMRKDIYGYDNASKHFDVAMN